MPHPGLRLKHLVFHGPYKPPASIEFGPALNVLYGASESGKSFVVEAIDFMLGGKQALRDIPERHGYDRILLGLETLAGDQFTLMRSVQGGGFLVYDGLHFEPPATEIKATELAEQHNEKNDSNLSMFLLQKCALAGKRVRKNKSGETNSLSFRNLARLLIVTESEIMDQRSPLSDGTLVTDTANFATFKILLTGSDDSALIPTKPKGPEEQSREAQLELLDQLLKDHRERLRELTKDPDDLEDQFKRLDVTLAERATQLATTESEYRSLSGDRRELRKKLEEANDRRSEIAALVERFALLDRHYVSDLARLRGIEEGGTLFVVLGKADCPLCGAPPAEHRNDGDCAGNVEGVVAAARSEIAKIELLRGELTETVSGLEREANNFDRRIPKIEVELRTRSEVMEKTVSPKLSQIRTAYSELADKRGEVREALAIYRSIKDVEARSQQILNRSDDAAEALVLDGGLSTTVTEKFAQQMEAVLKAWHFPNANRVFFDPKSRDVIIAGKPRTARGKGLRAITHAAFTIALLQYSKAYNTPHPGFVILDTPLRAYREPDGIDDDLRGTDLNFQFYNYLASLPDDCQVLIVENTDPPASIAQKPQVTMFTKNPNVGRYGFFPPIEEQKDEFESKTA